MSLKHSQDLKRKRSEDTEESISAEPLKKKGYLSRKTFPADNLSTPLNGCYSNPIEYWTEHNSWPPNFPAEEVNMGDFSSNKRSRSQSNKYSQGVKDGDNPTAWTRQHAEKMQEAGLIMAEYQAQAVISDNCRRLCNSILEADYPPPQGPLFQRDKLLKVLDQVQFRNEARVVRDITPIVVPSAELLFISDQPGLEHITEAMNAEWVQCDTLCGPRPKPDFVAGISPSAFSKEDKEKLKMNHTSACPNLFPENMYYPFLICEVKGSDRPIQEAERQAMHSASIAARAIIQLYRKISSAEQLNRQILTISVSHNNTTVKVFGHFAQIDEEHITFFRHRIYAADFAADFASRDWAKAYKITRGIYSRFFPKHLERITSALPKLRQRALESFTSHLGLDSSAEESSQEVTPSATSSQESGLFKKPSRPSTSKLQQENDRLRDQLLSVLHEQQAQNAQQKEEQQEQKDMRERQLAQQREQTERQLAQQKEEQREQKDMMERQLAQQREQTELQLAQQKEEQREQKDMMERQLAQQREQTELQLAQQKEEQREQKDMMERQLAQQKEEQREQKDMMERQLAQQKDMIELLKQSRS